MDSNEDCGADAHGGGTAEPWQDQGAGGVFARRLVRPKRRWRGRVLQPVKENLCSLKYPTFFSSRSTTKHDTAELKFLTDRILVRLGNFELSHGRVTFETSHETQDPSTSSRFAGYLFTSVSNAWSALASLRFMVINYYRLGRLRSERHYFTCFVMSA